MAMCCQSNSRRPCRRYTLVLNGKVFGIYSRYENRFRNTSLNASFMERRILQRQQKLFAGTGSGERRWSRRTVTQSYVKPGQY